MLPDGMTPTATSPAIAVEVLDPATVTVDSLRPWWAVLTATEAARDPASPLDPLEEAVASLLGTPASVHRAVLAGTRDPATGRPAGFVLAWTNERDNTHSLEVEQLAVHPGLRRRGHGTALLDHLRRVAADTGRTQLHLSGTEPLGSDGRAVPGTEFARAAGAVDVALEVRRTLDLTAPPDPAPAPATDPAAGYDLLGWDDATPEPLLTAMAALRAGISADAPAEDATLEAEVWDADRVRTADAHTLASGRASATTAARHLATGHLVAYTTMTANREQPTVGFQWDTYVSAAHRGHGLGLAVKRANTNRFRALSPGTRTVHTWNAGVNGHMIAINDALGYVATAQDRALELRL